MYFPLDEKPRICIIFITLNLIFFFIQLILVSHISVDFFNPKKGTKHGALVVTKDGGQNFEVEPLPFKLRDSDSIRFHPKRKDWIMAFEAEGASLSLKDGLKKVSKENYDSMKHWIFLQ